MTVLYRHEVPLLEKSLCDPALQRWRINLVALFVFAILISDTCDGFVSYLKASTPEPELFMCEINKTYSARNQCLYLSPDRSRECVVGSSPCKQTQSDILRNIHLPFCSFSPVSLMTQNLDGVSCRLNGTLQECRKCFDDLEKLDKSVQKMYEDFEGLLDRYDCDEDYSVRWDCNTCKVGLWMN